MAKAAVSLDPTAHPSHIPAALSGQAEHADAYRHLNTWP
jgi:hypothetical protein